MHVDKYKFGEITIDGILIPRSDLDRWMRERVQSERTLDERARSILEELTKSD
jgi:hypothetical protein